MSQGGLNNVENGDLPPDVPLTFVCDIGSASAAAYVLNVLGGAGASTTGSGNTIVVTVSSTGFTWNLVTSVSPVNPIQLVAENGYSCQGVALVTFILPLAPSFGDTFIVASTTSRFQINQNGGQQIRIGSSTTTAGSGSCVSNTVGDFIELVYMGSNLFQSFAPQGTLTLN